MTRVVHCKREPYDVYIGRGLDPRTGEPGRWGNVFSHLPGTLAEFAAFTRDATVENHRRWLRDEIAAGRITVEEIAALHGKTLGCWCDPPARCHGENLAHFAALAHEQLLRSAAE